MTKQKFLNNILTMRYMKICTHGPACYTTGDHLLSRDQYLIPPQKYISSAALLSLI
jgi:hypothetical protein